MDVDPDMSSDMGSGSVRLIGIGSVSGLGSFLALVDWEGLGEGEGEDDILSLREKSSRSASGVGQDTTTYCCFRGGGRGLLGRNRGHRLWIWIQFVAFSLVHLNVHIVAPINYCPLVSVPYPSDNTL